MNWQYVEEINFDGQNQVPDNIGSRSDWQKECSRPKFSVDLNRKENKQMYYSLFLNSCHHCFILLALRFTQLSKTNPLRVCGKNLYDLFRRVLCIILYISYECIKFSVATDRRLNSTQSLDLT